MVTPNYTIRGAHIARYYVYWDEVTYDKDGVESIRSRQWEDNGKNRTAGFQTELQFKGNVRNIRGKIQEKQVSVWGKMALQFTIVQTFLLFKTLPIVNSGTTLRPKIR